jgi:hypothetical protein
MLLENLVEILSPMAEGFCPLRKETGLFVAISEQFVAHSPPVYRIATFARVFYWSTGIRVSAGNLLRELHRARRGGSPLQGK